ncbi:MAG: phytoene/squalene synthase family protein [Ramlibacter sp.]
MPTTPTIPTDKLALLRGVSRSFYLSIRLLPAPLREPVAAAYLLARATDTLADTTELPSAARRTQLATLAAAIEGDAGARAAIGELSSAFAALQQDPHERHLILALPQCLAWLDALDGADQADIRTVLRHITLGQSLDIERFGNGPGPCALASADELDEYTWLVAGCVGEFWTDLCFRHLSGFASLPQPRMRELGRAYGSALQLINILRDMGADLAAGRCYLPADALAQAGLAPQDVAREPARLAPLYNHWLAQASTGLEQGMRYCMAVNHRRVRAGSALPALIGARTLALLQQAGPGALRQRVKVPRSEVHAILLRLAATLAAKGPLQARFVRLRG